jgi:hypothetical protein
MKFLPAMAICFSLAGGCIFSCNPYVANPCDTCNLNQDSLQKIKDSLAHAFEWTEYLDKIPGETSPSGIWIFGPNDIYITGNHLFHFDGTSFTEMLLKRISNGTGINVADDALYAFSKTDFWIVGGNAYHSIDGVHAEDLRPAIDIKSCWGTSSNDMFFVGNGGLIYHYDGAKFSEMNSGTTKDLRYVWGTSSKNVCADGFNYSTGESVLLHYDGNAWSEIDLSALGKFNTPGGDGSSALWACDSANNQFTFVGGSYFYRSINNGIWTNDSDKVGNKLNDGGYAGLTTIRGNNPSDILAVSDWGFAAHWNGKTWKRYDELYNPGNPSYLTNSMSFRENTACIVGDKSGKSWIVVGTRKEFK